MNYARFYLAEMLPHASRVLYLDADVIVLGDAVQLYDAALANGELCAAPLRKQRMGDPGVATFKSERLNWLYKERYGRGLPLEKRGFNAGVFIFNLRAWREHNLLAEVSRRRAV